MAGSGQIEEVPASDAWARLQADAGSILIDVRTRAEWTFVGLPDLSSIGKRVVTLEWQTFPEGRVDPGFAEKLEGLLESAGVAKDAEVFFICRSGARSYAAATALADAGYSRCRNVTEGFEGPLDTGRHRGQIAGWKAAGLPWTQG